MNFQRQKGRSFNRPITLYPEEIVRAFTLVELLVVMAVIIVLMSLSAVSFKGFNQANALTSGGDTITNLVALARQTATSRNTMTALVVLGAQSPATSSDYRSVTVLQYDIARRSWVQNTAWQPLPTGVVIDAGDTSNCTFLSNSPNSFAPATASIANPIVFNSKPVTNFAARIFLPNGGLLNAQDPANIRLVEGTWQGAQMSYTHRVPGGIGPANYYDVAILGATGQTKIGRP